MFSEREITGKKVLVTGGASGIGLCCVRLIAGMGARVAIIHLPEDPLAKDTIGDLTRNGLDVLSCPADVGESSAEPAIAHAIDRLGGLDCLINSAGVALAREPIPFSDLDALSDEFWQQMLSVNLLGAFRCARAAAPALRAAKGAIVNVSSASGEGKRGTSIPYSVSKGGLVTLTRCLAKALAPEVRVNAVAPGFIDTPMTADRGTEYRADVARKCLLQRVGTAEEVAEAIVFLCFGGGFMTGEVLTIDGGRSF
ncbi:MAG: SDR family oxidoreductase [Rhodospirillales bacterium]|nr:SDR family oxidoreductase [Rhodospirillales bacterium]